VTEPILSSRKLNKSFGPVHVLHDVDFDIYPGEVTALVGDNGAGKSTLVKCFAGINTIDRGELLFEGRPVVIHDPRAATALGIEVVYQDLALADNLDITQNMFLGRESRRMNSFLADGEMEKQARDTLTSLSGRCCGTARWSSSTSRRPPSAWPRRARCSTWCGG
jgi:D-xylose transport system ATP-binding protein